MAAAVGLLLQAASFCLGWSQARAQVSGSAASAAVATAQSFAGKARGLKCPDAKLRQMMEDRGRQIIGELQGLTGTAIAAGQSDISAALVNASVDLTEALHTLDQNYQKPAAEQSPPKIYVYRALTPPPPAASVVQFIPIIPSVGLGFSFNGGTANWKEPDGTDRSISLRHAQGYGAISIWTRPKLLFSPSGLTDWEAEFWDYCADSGWEDDDDDCYDYWGSPSQYATPGSPSGYVIKNLKSNYAADSKPGRPAAAVRWPLKPAKPYMPVMLRWGIENDLSLGTVSGNTATNCFISCRVSSNTLDTLVAKVGLQYGKFIPYAAGGLAYGNITTAAGVLPGNTSWKTGWTAGGGIEYKLDKALSAKLEYLYVDLGNGSCTPAGCGGIATVHMTENVVRFGISYAFNGSWPSSPPSAPMVRK